MKNQLAAIELRVLVEEFKRLEGSWLDQVYELESGSAASAAAKGKRLMLQLSASEGKRFLICLAPSAVFLSSKKPATAEKPGGFCSMLRQHLGNAKLVSVSQLGSERIFELVFSPRNRQQLRLVVELFSKGNVLLIDEKGVIICAAEHQAWKDRTVRPGFKYTLPPATADFANISAEELTKRVLSSERDSAVKALAVDIGLSGAYAEELCAAAKVDKAKSPAQLSQAEFGSLFSSLQKLLSRKPQPLAVLDGSNSQVEAFPFPTLASAAAKTKPFGSFSEAVEAVLLRQLDSSALSSEKSFSSRKVRELEIAIAQQQATVAEMEKVVKEATAAAEAIYVHYQDVNGILDDYNKLRKTFTPDQLKEYFGSNKIVKSIDEKTGTITLEVSGQ